jgi:hypothetical protein
MESLALIVDALVAGATAAAKETTTADSFQGFKELIQRKLSGNPKAVVVLEAHETDSHTYCFPLKKTLEEAGFDQDTEILRAARQLLEQAGALATAGPAINQKIRQVKYAAISGTGNASITVQEQGAASDGGA